MILFFTRHYFSKPSRSFCVISGHSRYRMRRFSLNRILAYIRIVIARPLEQSRYCSHAKLMLTQNVLASYGTSYNISCIQCIRDVHLDSQWEILYSCTSFSYYTRIVLLRSTVSILSRHLQLLTINYLKKSNNNKKNSFLLRIELTYSQFPVSRVPNSLRISIPLFLFPRWRLESRDQSVWVEHRDEWMNERPRASGTAWPLLFPLNFSASCWINPIISTSPVTCFRDSSVG